MTIQQQADSIVEKFKPYVDNEILEHSALVRSTYDLNATHCAIIYCEGILDALRRLDGNDVIEIEDNFILLLTELKSRI